MDRKHGSREICGSQVASLLPIPDCHRHFPFCILHFFDHIHFFGFYIGNYPALEPEKIDALGKILNAV
jgi:CDP-6-deoxy-D-xylo-4-hexulose-3-dehydrase